MVEKRPFGTVPKRRIAHHRPAQIFGALFVFLARSITIAHGGTSPSTAPATVDSLIIQLGSDSADDRDSAQKQLVEMGAPVIPALKKAATDNDDPEIRSRAAAALAQMKDLDANGASLITLHNSDTPVPDVLNSIASQAHVQFAGIVGSGVLLGAASRTISIEATRKPFWDVMTDVCGQLNICPVLDLPVKNTLRLLPSGRNWLVQSPHQIVGPYWVGVAGLYRARTIDLTGPQSVDDQFAVRMIVFPEPKLAVTQMSEFNAKEATDDAGHSLLLKSDAANRVLRNFRQMNRTIECRLKYPDQPGKSISILRGEVTVMLAQDVQQFEVDDVLGTPKVTNPITGCSIQATVARQGTELFHVTIQCSRQGISDDLLATMASHLSDVTIEDANGHPLTGIQTNSQMTDTTLTATMLFSKNLVPGTPVIPQVIKAGDANKLTWNIPTSVKPVVIPVTFKDLPMP